MLTLNAKPRDIAGKDLKTLRAGGGVPAVLYGAGAKTETVEVDAREFEKVWRTAGESGLVELVVDGSKKSVLIKDVQRDPLKGTPVHADFYMVRLDRSIRVTVPLEFIGEAPAIKQGAILVKVIRELDVEALPANLPNILSVDVSMLGAVGDRFLVSDLKLPPGVVVPANPADIIAIAEEPKAEEEAPAEAAPSLADIEVVGDKGKKEEEESVGEETKK